MVSKGLKVGDTFIDDSVKYMIDKVCEDGNYISHMIEVNVVEDTTIETMIETVKELAEEKKEVKSEVKKPTVKTTSKNTKKK